ncbi:GntR family transcriptional regulator [Atopobium sp. oral taxon 810]|uniref:GntR family transcriptional regulator n=1 Tax=Atopobium sp. oral taxon 810 TaxID=712158 RepID=UPI00039693A1|nr:GntR family transcriptional regulator [Atopobium sp. oral taxon 810]ERI05497.1 UbiC transcription regulator-associated domain protein [Atopobium sp. oral taxon 810 str. F0209]
MNALETLCATPLDPESPEPLYMQLKQRILQLIAAHGFDVDEPLPSEMLLCEKLNLSRATVRRCFKDLVDSGRVIRRRGQGSFISLQPTNQGLDTIFSFSNEMKNSGQKPTSRVISLQRRVVAPSIAKHLHVRSDTEVWEIRRLRMGDGRPIRLETAYIPVDICPNLSRDDLVSSLYAHIAEASGGLPERAEEIYEAVALDSREAKLLDAQAGAPAMRVIRVTIDNFGRAFEASVLIWPGTTTRLAVTTTSNSVAVKRISARR